MQWKTLDMEPGAYSNFSITIQIRWKIGISVIPLYGFITLKKFSHVTTAQLWCHVQNFIVSIHCILTRVRAEINFHRIWIFELRRRSLWGQDTCYFMLTFWGMDDGGKYFHGHMIASCWPIDGWNICGNRKYFENTVGIQKVTENSCFTLTMALPRAHYYTLIISMG